jgi:hypothetical protein
MADTKQEGIQQDFQGDPRAEDCETSSRDFHWVAESEGLDIMEGSAPSEMEKETAYRVKAGNVGALATVSSSAPLNGKSGMMVQNLDRLAPYLGAAQDELP